MSGCIFCGIRDGPKDKQIFENGAAFVILDKFPSEEGHMLVISKRHSQSMLEAGDDDVSAMFLVAKRMASRAKERLGAEGVNVATNIGREAGQIIDHFHVHVIPRFRPKRRMPHNEMQPELEAELIARLR
jgi:histidine triad (HIT) family protein